MNEPKREWVSSVSERVNLRDVIAEMKKRGWLVEVSEQVDWNLEAGAALRYCAEADLPALLFTNVKGTMPGTKVVGGLFATPDRFATCLGLPEANYHDMVDWFVAASKREIAPIVVSSGSCQENVILGDQVDLLKFPALFLHPRDGGGEARTGRGGKRYFATLATGVCRDLDSDWVNWGTYRGMVVDKRSEAIWMSPFNHGGAIFQKYNDRKRVMEYAQFMGGDLLYNVVAGSGVPWGVSEVNVVGGMRGRPVELVKCKTVDLYVPADAEIVIEGTIAPNDLEVEGPFGEALGYMGVDPVPRPAFRVSAITHRTDPVLVSYCLGVPVDEGICIASIGWCGFVKEALIRQGLPIDKVSVSIDGASQFVVVSVKQPLRLPGIPQKIASTIWSDRNGAFMSKVVVVDNDIDPNNLREVWHVLATKCNAATDIYLYPGYINIPLAPYLSKADPLQVGAGGGNVLFDCTYPFDWKLEERPDRLSFSALYTQELQARTVERLKNWGVLKG